MKWCPKLRSDIKFRHEFVEVLQDHVYAISVHVAYMDKEKGFTCLFHRVEHQFLLLAKDILLHKNSLMRKDK